MPQRRLNQRLFSLRWPLFFAAIFVLAAALANLIWGQTTTIFLAAIALGNAALVIVKLLARQPPHQRG